MMKYTLYLLLAGLLLIHVDLDAQGDRKLYCFSSTDGTTFYNPVLVQDSADVPSLAVDSNGTIYVAYQNFAGGQAQRDKIALKTSTDGGQSWSLRSMPVFTGFTGSTERIFDPTIRITELGQFRIYFSYCPNSMVLDSTCCTYSALSSDGINYTFDSGTRFCWPGRPVIDPTTVYFNGQWQYCAPSGAPQDGAWHATSPDGLNFAFQDSTPSDMTHNWTGNLMDNGSEIRFYGGLAGGSGQLWWSSSTDGSSWSGFVPTNITGKDPAVYRLGPGDYIMVVPLESFIPLTVTAPTAQSLRIWPNPAGDLLQVDAGSSGGQWAICDLNGRELASGELGNRSALDLSNLAAGMYLLCVQDGSRIQYARFVKR